MTETSRRPTSTQRQPVAPVPDSVSAWLDVMAALLNLTEPERAEVREELESHLRDRVRDLMLGGADSEEATTRAIGELGGAAELAGRFRSVREEQRRRRIMNVLGLGVAAGAAVVSIAALVRTGGPPSVGQSVPAGVPAMIVQNDHPDTTNNEVQLLRERVAELEKQLSEEKIRVSAEPYPKRAGDSDALKDLTVFEDVSEKPFSVGLSTIASKAGLKLDIPEWLKDTEPFKKLESPVTVREYLRMRYFESNWYQALDYRVVSGVLHVARRMDFRRMDAVVCSYDITTLLGYGDPSGKRIVEAIRSIVGMDPKEFTDSKSEGFEVVGPTLIVRGDQTVQQQVKWVLRQTIFGAQSPVTLGGGRASDANATSLSK